MTEHERAVIGVVTHEYIDREETVSAVPEIRKPDSYQEAGQRFFGRPIWGLAISEEALKRIPQDCAAWLGQKEDTASADAKGVEGASRSLGTQGGTLERVREARQLIELGMPKTKACKRAHTDPRTYDRYVAEIMDWKDPYLR